MGSILAIILLALLMTQPKDAKRSELTKNLICALVILGIAGMLLPIIGRLVGIAAIGGMVWFLLKKRKDRRAFSGSRQKNGWETNPWKSFFSQESAFNSQSDYSQESAFNSQSDYSQESAFNSQSDWQSYNSTDYRHSTGTSQASSLPASDRKRADIVHAFNEKYELCLTEEQVQSIVSSSYMSVVWKQELEAMNRPYETVHQWLQGPTSWLRIYMHAFHIQEITSDIEQQESIVMYTFECFFNYVDTLENMTLSEKIAKANHYFMTSFDDISFMGAYRYMESKGMKHHLGHKEVLRNEDLAEELTRKYET